MYIFDMTITKILKIINLKYSSIRWPNQLKTLEILSYFFVGSGTIIRRDRGSSDDTRPRDLFPSVYTLTDFLLSCVFVEPPLCKLKIK